MGINPIGPSGYNPIFVPPGQSKIDDIKKEIAELIELGQKGEMDVTKVARAEYAIQSALNSSDIPNEIKEKLQDALSAIHSDGSINLSELMKAKFDLDKLTT